MKKARFLLVSLLASALLVSVLPSAASAAVSLSQPDSPASPASQGATSSALSLLWSAPASGPAPSAYEVYLNGSKVATSKEKAATVSGLLANTSYDVTIKACNDAGCSQPSDPTSMATKPNTPSNVKATAKDQGLEVTFTPSSGSLSLSNKVWFKPLRSGTWTEWTPGVSDVSPTLVSGLTNGAPYSIKVESGNSSYTVSSLAVSGTPAAVPAAPVLVLEHSKSTSSSLAVSWVAPDSNGSAVREYEMFLNGTKVGRTTSPSFVFDKLSAAKSYSLSATACNAAGCSSPSGSLQASTRPLPPSVKSVTPASGGFVVTYTPAQGASSHSVKYRKTTDSASAWTEWTPGVSDASPTTVTGLINGTSYTVVVEAVIGGVSSLSQTQSVTPIAAPSSPVLSLKSVTLDTASLSWTVPTNQGARYTMYEVFSNGSLYKESPTPSLVMQGLEPAASHTVKVRACTSTKSCSPFSADLVVRTRPKAPTGVATEALSGRVVVSFTPSLSAGVTHRVLYKLSTAPLFSTWSPAANATSPVVVYGLKGGSLYSFAVESCLSAVLCSVSSAVTKAPLASPDTPVVEIKSASHSEAIVSLETPTGSVTPTYYEVVRDGSTTTHKSQPVTISSLSPRTSYLIKARACSSASVCSPFSEVQTLQSGPLPPTNVTVSPALGSLVVSFVPSAGSQGHKIEYREYSSRDWTELTPGVIDSSPATIPALPAGVTYQVRVGAAGSESYITSHSSVQEASPTGVPQSPSAANTKFSPSTVDPKTRAVITLSSPSNTGGVALKSFNIKINGKLFSALASLASFEVTGLLPGRSYTAEVSACNEYGCSAQPTLVTVYTAPSIIDHSEVAPNPKVDSVEIVWPHDQTAVVEGYKVRYRKAGSKTWISTATTSLSKAVGPSLNNAQGSYLISKLSPATDYEVQVAPYNTSSDSWPPDSPATVSSFTTEPIKAPGSLPSAKVVKDDRALTLQWSVTGIDTGGAPITGFHVTKADAKPDGSCPSPDTLTSTFVAAGSSSYRFSGLTNAKLYCLNVAAINSTGSPVRLGAFLQPSLTAMPRTVPEAPRELKATPKDGSIELSWLHPIDTRGAPVTKYSIAYGQMTSGRPSYSTNVEYTVSSFNPEDKLSYVLQNLKNGASYSIQVTTHNEAGPGGYQTRLGVVPVAAPSAPTNFKGVSGNKSVSLSWTAPTSLGGSASVSYRMYAKTAQSDWSVIADNLSQMSLTVTALGNTPLANGTEYFFKVSALGSGIEGPATQLANSLVPLATPSAPTGVVAIPGRSQVELSWSAPQDNGGEDPTSYVIQQKSQFDVSFKDIHTLSNANTFYTVPLLKNGISYEFKVAARNSSSALLGTDKLNWSAPSSPVTPVGPPSPPRNLSLSAGRESVALSWTAPEFNNGAAVSDYIIQYSDKSNPSEADWLVWPEGTSDTPSALVDGLSASKTYLFRVLAENSCCKSDPTPVLSATPYGAPLAPAKPVVSPQNASVRVSWTPPNSNGSPIKSYDVQYTTVKSPAESDWSESISSTGSPLTVTGLTNGLSYVFRVRASNDAGPGPFSLGSDPVTPSAPPSAPLNLEAVAGPASVALSWDPPVFDGGLGIRGYVVRYVDGSGKETTLEVSGTTRTVSSLINGTEYSFYVKAVSNNSSSSTETGPVKATPLDAPARPDPPVVTALSSSVELRWTAPNSNGSPIKRYDVQYTTVKSPAESDWISYDTTDSTALFVTVDGLTNGTEYYFRIRAENAVDKGLFSLPSLPAKPLGLPGAVSLTAKPGDRSFEIFWTAPANTGGSPLDSYAVYRKLQNTPSAPATLIASGLPSSKTSLGNSEVSGLINGQTYFFAVIAKNQAGKSIALQDAVFHGPFVPYGKPHRPAKPQVTASKNTVTLSWSAPFDNGNAIDGYDIFYDAVPSAGLRSVAVSGDSLSHTIEGLENGKTYFFQIAARNDAGAGEKSPASDYAIPFTVPDPPTGLSAVSGPKSVTLSWLAPGFNGGRTIDGYSVDQYQGTTAPALETDWVPAVATTTKTSVTITGLTDGEPYVFRVSAKNTGSATEFSAPSQPSLAVTPYSPTSAPVFDGADEFDKAIKIRWNPPSDLGGGTVKSYTIRYAIGKSSCEDTGWSSITVPASSLNELLLSNLINGANYRFCISALNESGSNSPWSDISGSFRPQSAPSEPLGLVVKPLDKALRVTWLKPASDGGHRVLSYVIEYGETNSSDTPTTQSVTAEGPLEAVLGDLENGSSYYVKVKATSDFAPEGGPFSQEVSETPYGKPEAPSPLSFTVRAFEIDLSWTAPYDNGSAIKHYVVSWRPSNASESSATTRIMEPGTLRYTIKNGVDGAVIERNREYSITVHAVSKAEGTKAAVIARTAVAKEPDKLVITKVDRAHRRLIVHFSKPASDGGAKIIRYEYRLNSLSAFEPVSPAPVLQPDGQTLVFNLDKHSQFKNALERDTEYRISIRAVNEANLQSQWSQEFSARTAGPPGLVFPEVTSTEGINELSFSWSPIDDQGDSVTSYEYSTDDGLTWSKWASAPYNTADGKIKASIDVVSGPAPRAALQNGVTYKVRWRAGNQAGYSYNSPSLSLVPHDVPDAPTITDIEGGTRSLTVKVSQAPWNGGAAVLGYRYRVAPLDQNFTGDFVESSPAGTSGIFTISSLGNNTDYKIEVVSYNRRGPSAPSPALSGLTNDKPGQPSVTSYKAAPNQITVRFAIPDYDGRTPIRKYKYILDENNTQIEFTPINLSFTGNGVSGEFVIQSPSGQWRTIQVLTQNDVGDSPVSTPFRIVAAYEPSPPRSLVASRGLASAPLSWLAPLDSGLVAIKDYEYSRQYNGEWGPWFSLSSTNLSRVVSGLGDCVSNTFKVRAINEAGLIGQESNLSEAATFCKPAAPPSVSIVALERQVLVTWQEPASGGTPVRSYSIKRSQDGGASWSVVTADTRSTSRSYTDSAANGVTYVYSVAAINDVGTGAFSAKSNTATPFVPPPTGATAGSKSASSASFSWNASGSAHLASSDRYRVYRDSTYIGATNDTSFNATGLSENTSYNFYIYAVDNLGTFSSATVVSITTNNAPATATSVTIQEDSWRDWVAQASNVKRRISFNIDPTDNEDYSSTGFCVQEGASSCLSINVTTPSNSQSGVSGHIEGPFTYGRSYTVTAYVCDSKGVLSNGCSYYVRTVNTAPLSTAAAYINESGYMGNNTGELTSSRVVCGASSTDFAIASCPSSFDSYKEGGWTSKELASYATSSANSASVWFDITDDRHENSLGFNATTRHPAKPAGQSAYKVTGFRLWVPMQHTVRIEIDPDGGNNAADYDLAKDWEVYKYQTAGIDIDIPDVRVAVDSYGVARWTTKFILTSPKDYCSDRRDDGTCPNPSTTKKKRVSLGHVYYGVDYWKSGGTSYS